jgi:hypothetical protein
MLWSNTADIQMAEGKELQAHHARATLTVHLCLHPNINLTATFRYPSSLDDSHFTHTDPQF